MITTKSGATVVAGGLLTAGLAYLFARNRASRTSAPPPESEHPISEPRLRLHEVSSLVGDHALAPDRAAIGESMADPDVVELPIGQTADLSYNEELRHDKWPQPDTTGTVLKPPAESAQDGFVDSIDLEPLFDAEFDDDLQDIDGGVSARPSTHRNDTDDEFDSLGTDDLGARFLARATQAPRFDEEPVTDNLSTPWDWSSVNPEQLSPDGASALSEASVNGRGYDERGDDEEPAISSTGVARG